MLLLAGCASGPRTPVKGVFKSSRPYTVRGGYYEPQQYYEYDESGLASWYGPGFHGRPKATGVRFDQWGISAAHRTLPLPTVVKVTNLENGRQLKLIVDDRGPYTYKGRIIDLSVGAAKALGTYSKGIARVRVQSVVDESMALSLWLKRYGRGGRSKDGRTWQQIYRDEIAGKHSDQTVIGIPLKESSHKKNESTQNSLKHIKKVLKRDLKKKSKKNTEKLEDLLKKSQGGKQRVKAIKKSATVKKVKSKAKPKITKRRAKTVTKKDISKKRSPRLKWSARKNNKK